MPFTPYTFNDTVTQTEPGRPRVPEGYYLVEWKDAKATPETYDKTPGINLQALIVEAPDHAQGTGVGRTMPYYVATGALNGKEPQQFALGRLLGSVKAAAFAVALKSRPINSYAEHSALGQAVAKVLVGKRSVVLISDQPSTNGRAFSGIEEVLPADDWEAQKHDSLTVPAPASPRAASGNGVAPTTPETKAAFDDQINAFFSDIAEPVATK